MGRVWSAAAHCSTQATAILYPLGVRALTQSKYDFGADVLPAKVEHVVREARFRENNNIGQVADHWVIEVQHSHL